MPISGEAIIGKDLAYRLGKDLNEEIYVYSPVDQSFGFGLPKKIKLNISGIFSTNILDYDDRYVFLTMNDGLSLFKRKSGHDGADIKIIPGSDIEKIKLDSNDFMFHAGTDEKDSKVVAIGGRVLNFVSLSEKFVDAKKKYYKTSKRLKLVRRLFS